MIECLGVARNSYPGVSPCPNPNPLRESRHRGTTRIREHSVRATFPSHFSKNRADKKPKGEPTFCVIRWIARVGRAIPPLSIVHVCLEHVGSAGFVGLHRYRPKAQKFRTEFLGLHGLHCFDRKLLLEGGTDWRICKSSRRIRALQPTRIDR